MTSTDIRDAGTPDPSGARRPAPRLPARYRPGSPLHWDYGPVPERASQSPPDGGERDARPLTTDRHTPETRTS
jgi:hypothetical protein